MYKFELEEKQQKQLDGWLENIVYPQAIEINREQLSEQLFESLTGNGQYPYYGASGGGLTFKFTPTSLGTAIKVQEGLTGKEIDLTNYKQW